jgi:hypothetical protein
MLSTSPWEGRRALIMATAPVWAMPSLPRSEQRRDGLCSEFEQRSSSGMLKRHLRHKIYNEI